VVGPSVSVPVPDAPGNWMFLNDAHRYQRGEIPTKAQPFFDESKSFNVFPAVPPSDVMPDYPCDGCPVNGGSAT
jgi:hypothetical protein